MIKNITPSDALRHLMNLHKHELAEIKKKGDPPQGKCADCKRDVPAHEIAVKCDKCDNTFVCVNCIDKHDHIHDQLKGALHLA